MLKKSLIVVAGIWISGCSQDVQVNETSYALYRSNAAMSGPLGRLLALNEGFEVDYDKVRVCVEGTKSTMTDSELVLETKIAYAAWLNTAQSSDLKIGQEDFDKFEFVVRSKCKRNDNNFSAVVVSVEEGNIEAVDELEGSFASVSIECKKANRRSSCGQTSGMTLGWGSSGLLTQYYNRSNPNKWTKLQGYKPATAYMSQFVEWRSIQEDLLVRTSSELNTSTRNKMVADYREMLVGEPSLEELVAFNDSLTEQKMLGAKGNAFNTLFQGFVDSREDYLLQEYRPEKTYYNTLLHEVGHQFGLSHADDPGRDTDTGPSAQTTLDNNEEHVTEISAMAYGLPYMYLTDDDRAGSAENAKRIRSLLRSRK